MYVYSLRTNCKNLSTKILAVHETSDRQFFYDRASKLWIQFRKFVRKQFSGENLDEKKREGMVSIYYHKRCVIRNTLHKLWKNLRTMYEQHMKFNCSYDLPSDSKESRMEHTINL